LGERGSQAFDAAALRGLLVDLPNGQQLSPAHVSQYRQFYGLDYKALPHQHRLFCLSSGQYRLAVQYFLPDQVDGYVMLCHGYYDHVGLYGHVIQYFLERGIAVVAYDQIGHGLSGGRPVTIDNFDRYVEATRVVYEFARLDLQDDKPWHWFGQSMGGAVVMEYHQQYPSQPGATGEVILFAPLIRPYAWGVNRWVFALAKRLITERARTLTDNAENPEFHALQKKDPLQAHVLPVAWVQAMVNWQTRFVRYPISQQTPLLVQGNADRTVDWKYGLQTYARRYPGTRQLILDGGRHHLANESSSKRAQIWAFLDQQGRW